MKQRLAALLGAVLLGGSCIGCGGQDGDGSIVFKDKLTDSFGGIGVEVDAYEHPNLLSEEKWDLAIRYLEKLAPAHIRCMISYDWFLRDYDDCGTEDPADDTWSYDWNDASMKSMYRIFDVCREKGIDVAVGPWRAVDDARWGMDKTLSSDPRWAKISVDLLKKLVKTDGYSCVKYFVPTNEPNYIKNNTFFSWKTGVENVAAGLAAESLDVAVLGSDASGYADGLVWTEQTAAQLADTVGGYSMHMYVSDYIVDTGKFRAQVADLAKKITDHDSSDTPFYLWEAGLIDGREEGRDSNALIDTFDYGRRMADYTLQAILGGVDGVTYWELDDAAHFLPDSTNGTWGMFSSLGDAAQQELRPWFHSSALLSKLFCRGSRIYTASVNDAADAKLRALAAVAPDGEAGWVAVNRGEAQTHEFVLDPAVKSGEAYVYVFSEQAFRLNADGYMAPNYVVKADLNKKLKLELPAKSVVFVTTSAL